MRTIVTTILLAALGVACSKEDHELPPAPGCDLGYGVCASGLSTETCALEMGAWRPGGCAPGALGMCIEDGSGRITSYYAPDWDAWWAEWDCSGTWLPASAPDTGEEVTVSCTIAGLLCVDMTASFTQDTLDSFEADCTADGYGSMARAPCALATPVPGYCSITGAVSEPGVTSARMFFSASLYTLEDARASCSEDGAGIWID